MTTDLNDRTTNGAKLGANLERIEELSQRLVAALSNHRAGNPALQGPGSDLMAKTSAAFLADMMASPAKMIEQQVSYWGQSLTLFIEAQQAMAAGTTVAPESPGPADPRFKSTVWDTHPYFNFVKQQYLMSADVISGALDELDGLDAKDQKRVRYFSRQIIDMFSPSNFLATNPEALAHAAETEGQSLVDGLENLVRDLEAGDGDLIVRLTDDKAFEVGENIATSPGSVVFRNRMFELIQYAPTTQTVHKAPLIIFPPWINKFYIMDLKPQNSLIKWIVDQGYTLFVVSWVNPDQSYAEVLLDDYIQEGYLTAIEAVKKIMAEEKVNAVGYCIAGTTLSLTLALMAKRGDKSVNAATFFTTLTDFEDQGELGVFLDNDFVDGIEEEVGERGILDSFILSRTFSFLRSNDLIYGPAIRSYMMGKAPPAFDLLYWNGDGTNLPAAMTVQYLRHLCQGNTFAQGGIEICGETLNVRDIKVPFCAIACETDHIAAWKSSFDGFKNFGSRSKSFILSESGHVAGIINPPTKKKYGHYLNDAKMSDADEWFSGATKHSGSWWPKWGDWLAKRSGRQVPARIPGYAGFDVFCPAPGTYVKRKGSEKH